MDTMETQLDHLQLAIFAFLWPHRATSNDIDNLRREVKALASTYSAQYRTLMCFTNVVAYNKITSLSLFATHIQIAKFCLTMFRSRCACSLRIGMVI